MCRSGTFQGPTAGLAPGYVQANLVMLAEDWAGDFRLFCERNSGPCPLLEVTQPGVYEPSCAPGADLRTDLPMYRAYGEGQLLEQPIDVLKYCKNQGVEAHPTNTFPQLGGNRWVCFLLGCSFTFESVLLREGIPIRHIEQKRNVPMYRTDIPCIPAGTFSGPMVVSMRPMTLKQAERATEITRGMPGSHGAPVHVGEPGSIG